MKQDMAIKDSVIFYNYSADDDVTVVYRFYPSGVLLHTVLKGKFEDLSSVLEWLHLKSYKTVKSTHYYKEENTLRYRRSHKDGIFEYISVMESGMLRQYGQSLNGIPTKAKYFYPYNVNQTLFKWNTINKGNKIDFKTVAQSSQELKPKTTNNVASRSNTQQVSVVNKDVKNVNSSPPPLHSTLSTESTSILNPMHRFIVIALMCLGLFTCATRKKIGATCRDGSESRSTGSGTCSHHGGVSSWTYTYWWDN